MKKLKAAATRTSADTNTADDDDTTITATIINKTRRKTFDFVIIGTLAHQSKDDAIEYLEHLLNKDKRVIETNIFHIFGDYYQYQWKIFVSFNSLLTCNWFYYHLVKLKIIFGHALYCKNLEVPGISHHMRLVMGDICG